MVEAFIALNTSLCDHCKLCIPCNSDCFLLEMDASSTGIGAVLSVCRDGLWRPASFLSKQFQGPPIEILCPGVGRIGIVYIYYNHFAIIFMADIF